MTNQTVAFKGQNLTIITRDNQPYFSSADLAKALGYTQPDQITRLYNRHADEFTPDMSQTVKLTVSGNLVNQVRVFSLRGCHLLAMFSKTPVAKEFRRWVLDLIESHNQALDAKAVGGIVKSCCAVAVREELEKISQDLAYTAQFKKLAAEGAADALNEDFFGILKKLLKNWTKDAVVAGLDGGLDNHIAKRLFRRVKLVAQWAAENDVELSPQSWGVLVARGVTEFAQLPQDEFKRQLKDGAMYLKMADDIDKEPVRKKFAQ